MNTSKHVKLYDHKDISYRLLSSYHYACADVECFIHKKMHLLLE